MQQFRMSSFADRRSPSKCRLGCAVIVTANPRCTAASETCPSQLQRRHQTKAPEFNSAIFARWSNRCGRALPPFARGGVAVVAGEIR